MRRHAGPALMVIGILHMVLFAAAHAYWAFGGTALLSAAMGKDSREQWDRDPRGYAVSWAILTLLLVCAGLFPAALAWRGGRVDQRRMERLAVASGYAGMVSLIGLGLATGEPGLSVVGGGGAALGGVFALVRPRGERVSRWLVLVATWGLGGAMIVYGCAYLGVVAFSTVERDNLLAYLVAGGMNWSLGGILFVTTAWLSRGGVRRK